MNNSWQEPFSGGYANECHNCIPLEGPYSTTLDCTCLINVKPYEQFTKIDLSTWSSVGSTLYDSLLTTSHIGSCVGNEYGNLVCLFGLWDDPLLGNIDTVPAAQIAAREEEHTEAVPIPRAEINTSREVMTVILANSTNSVSANGDEVVVALDNPIFPPNEHNYKDSCPGLMMEYNNCPAGKLCGACWESGHINLHYTAISLSWCVGNDNGNLVVRCYLISNPPVSSSFTPRCITIKLS